MDKSKWFPSEENIKNYTLYSIFLDTIEKEVKTMAAKKPEVKLTLKKIEILNRVLKPLKEDILAHEPTAIFLDVLEEDDIPTNSDAVLIMAQFQKAITIFRHRYYKKDSYQYGESRWITSEKPHDYYKEEWEKEEKESEEE